MLLLLQSKHLPCAPHLLIERRQLCLQLLLLTSCLVRGYLDALRVALLHRLQRLFGVFGRLLRLFVHPLLKSGHLSAVCLLSLLDPFLSRRLGGSQRFDRVAPDRLHLDLEVLKLPCHQCLVLGELLDLGVRIGHLLFQRLVCLCRLGQLLCELIDLLATRTTRRCSLLLRAIEIRLEHLDRLRTLVSLLGCRSELLVLFVPALHHLLKLIDSRLKLFVLRQQLQASRLGCFLCSCLRLSKSLADFALLRLCRVLCPDHVGLQRLDLLARRITVRRHLALLGAQLVPLCRNLLKVCLKSLHVAAHLFLLRVGRFRRLA
mmetsp:Transcript_39835/g.78026  ORF Transcript_39835/g.78026 Transcript_39835/m.78026 type:complete len:318 (-) Transcript_39835:1991-2944(-)